MVKGDDSGLRPRCPASCGRRRYPTTAGGIAPTDVRASNLLSSMSVARGNIHSPGSPARPLMDARRPQTTRMSRWIVREVGTHCASGAVRRGTCRPGAAGLCIASLAALSVLPYSSGIGRPRHWPSAAAGPYPSVGPGGTIHRASHHFNDSAGAQHHRATSDRPGPPTLQRTTDFSGPSAPPNPPTSSPHHLTLAGNCSGIPAAASARTQPAGPRHVIES